MIEFSSKEWALIRGGSTGFGLATAKKLSRHGMSVCVLHRDRRGAMKRINQDFDSIRQSGHGFLSLNVDALKDEGRSFALSELESAMGESGRVRVLLHSIASGNLKPLAPNQHDPRVEDTLRILANEFQMEPQIVSEKLLSAFSQGASGLHPLIPSQYPAQQLAEEDFAQTIYAMGTSLSSWVTDLHRRALFAKDARVLAMTSEGNEVAWRSYGAVAAAKAVVESVCRAIALEYAPFGIRANVIQAGVSDTPALSAVPGNGQMKAAAELRNPMRRLTRPEDVADFICLMATDEAAWVNGSLLRVDGGERIASA